MKGIILAGGLGTRLHPITKIINKHLLPVYNKPMIFYPLETLIKAGIKEIIIVTNPQDLACFHKILGYGENFGVKISYVTQKNPGGIAEALNLTQEEVKNDKMVLILGDNIFLKGIGNSVEKFKKQKKGAKIFLIKVKDPKNFGVPKFEGNKIVEIIEKPENPETNFAVPGIYFYNNDVFEIIKTIKPSKRNELEITDVNNEYIKRGEMRYQKLKSKWIDAGESFESLYLAGNIIKKTFKNK